MISAAIARASSIRSSATSTWPSATLARLTRCGSPPPAAAAGSLRSWRTPSRRLRRGTGPSRRPRAPRRPRARADLAPHLQARRHHRHRGRVVAAQRVQIGGRPQRPRVGLPRRRRGRRRERPRQVLASLDQYERACQNQASAPASSQVLLGRSVRHQRLVHQRATAGRASRTRRRRRRTDRLGGLERPAAGEDRQARGAALLVPDSRS